MGCKLHSDFDRLDLSSRHFLEKSVENMVDGMDALRQDQERAEFRKRSPYQPCGPWHMLAHVCVCGAWAHVCVCVTMAHVCVRVWRMAHVGACVCVAHACWRMALVACRVCDKWIVSCSSLIDRSFHVGLVCEDSRATHAALG